MRPNISKQSIKGLTRYFKQQILYAPFSAHPIRMGGGKEKWEVAGDISIGFEVAYL